MFQYISVFLSHYPPKRPPFPRGSDGRISDKQVRARAQCSCIVFCLWFTCSLRDSVCHHIARSYLSVYYTHCPGTTRRSFILHRSSPSWYMELLHFYITTLLQSKHTFLLYHLTPGLSQCVLKGKCVCWLVFFPVIYPILRPFTLLSSS